MRIEEKLINSENKVGKACRDDVLKKKNIEGSNQFQSCDLKGMWSPSKNEFIWCYSAKR